MADNQSSDNAAVKQPRQQKRHWLIYGIIAVVAVIILVVLFLPTGSGSNALAQTSSANATPIYLSASNAGPLVESAISNYTTFDLYNSSAPITMSDLVQMVPQLKANATSGWGTLAIGSNSIANASLEYFVITTSNAKAMTGLLGTNLTAGIGGTPVLVTPGYANGLNYTYGLYQNATNSTQVVYGWKGSNAVFLIIQGSNGFSANQSRMVYTAASVPLQ